MLIFAGTVWQLVSLVSVFLLGGMLAVRLSRVFGVPVGRAIFFYLWHALFYLVFFWFSQGGRADSSGYYLESLDYGGGIEVGTAGVEWLASICSVGLGLSYGGVSLVFSLFGFVGLLALAGALRGVSLRQSMAARRTILLLLMLPSISFWTSGIGKDAISFMGAGLACWASLNLSRRYPAMVIAVLAIFFVRPHIAAILIACLAITVIVMWRGRPLHKLLLALAILPAAIVGVRFGIEFAGFGGAVTASDVTEFIDMRQGYNSQGSSSIDIAGMSVAGRIFAYIFRPLFFDAPGLMGLLVSFEHLVILLVAMWFIVRVWRAESDQSLFARGFCFLFVFTSLLVLANTTANLGIAIRQKYMFLPMLYLLIFSYGGRPRNKTAGIDR
jgi:hypothetical protein